MSVLLRFGSVLLLVSWLSACGGGGSGGSSSNSTGPVTISGTASYEDVPHYSNGYGWNFANTTERPIRGASVEAVDAEGNAIATDQTDANGNYSVSVARNTQVLIRVKAELVQTGSPSWDISVTDNTSSYALYALEGNLASSGTANSSRDLVAETGWGGLSYTGERAAAPFAILDQAYKVVQFLVETDAGITIPELQLSWSVDNDTDEGSAEDGDIETSHYSYDGSISRIYLLGDTNSDADEFDEHVIVHEMGHFFEHRFSRIDNIGGAHYIGDLLDLRVAYSEGLATAFAAMVLDDPNYKDGQGSTLYAGFGFSVEDNSSSDPDPGWYNESSVQIILYDLYDSNSDNADNISLGFDPLYQTITNTADKDAFMSIFTFREEFDDRYPTYSSGLAALLTEQAISGTDQYGANETNDLSLYGGNSVLPLYRELTANGSAITVCSTDDYDDYSEGNKVSSAAFLRFNAASSGSYQVDISLNSASTATTDPDFLVYQQGSPVGSGQSETDNSESASLALAAGNYVMEVYHYGNIDTETDNDAKACFDVSLAL